MKLSGIENDACKHLVAGADLEADEGDEHGRRRGRPTVDVDRNPVSNGLSAGRG